MTHIYLALVDTPGLFASLIRCFIHQRHIHVVISMDADLEEAYSVGRRNPFIPILAGFEKENKEKIYCPFPWTMLQLLYRMIDETYILRSCYAEILNIFISWKVLFQVILQLGKHLDFST